MPGFVRWSKNILSEDGKGNNGAQTNLAAPRADTRRLSSFPDRWRDYLLAPVDGASLAVFRICFGLLMLCDVWRYWTNGWITSYYVKPTFHFTYFLAPFVRPWPGDGMYWHFGVLGLLAMLIAVGLFYRLAAWGFFLGFTYVFLL